MKDPREHINLKFNCQEDIESMSCSEKGKFCSACQKEVIDFTQMSYSEIQQVKGNQTEMCGIFLPEQIDPSLNPIELPKVRSLAFLSSILFSLNFGSTNAQSAVDPKIEQFQGANNTPNLTPEEAKRNSESSQHISISQEDTSAPQTNLSSPDVPNKQREKHLRKMRRKSSFGPPDSLLFIEKVTIKVDLSKSLNS